MDKTIDSASWLAMHRVLDLCMEISTTTKADCFFSYSPHVNTYTVSIHRGGWASGEIAKYLDLNSDITRQNLGITCATLRKIYEELKEEENV